MKMILGIAFILPLAAYAEAGEGPRLAAILTTQRSAAGYSPSAAGDGSLNTLWIADAQPSPANNRVWVQLDVGTAQPIAKLHWVATLGAPYPSWGPTELRVLSSNDAAHWRQEALVSRQGDDARYGAPVLLDCQARYIRIETTKIGDGTGWGLGLREIWLTGGYEAPRTRARPRASARDGRIALTWTAPPSVTATQSIISRSENPNGPFRQIARRPGASGSFVDAAANWTTMFYRIQTINGRGESRFTFDVIAATAQPLPLHVRPETFAFWYQPYIDHHYADSTISRVGNVPFIIGPAQPEIARALAAAGRGLYPYLTVYQTSRWVTPLPSSEDPNRVASYIAPFAFHRNGVAFDFGPAGYIPTMSSRPENVEFDPAHIQYTVCANSIPLREAALAFVNREIAAGAAGFFVDNGYQDDLAADATCDSTWHAHYSNDDLTGADAFIGLVLAIRNRLKRARPDGLVIINGRVPSGSTFYGVGFWDVADALLWENFVTTSSCDPKSHETNWDWTHERSIGAERDAVAHPVFALSYPLNRDEAIFSYATAKLSNLPWAASIGDKDKDHPKYGGFFGTYPDIVSSRLGTPVNPTQYGGARAGAIYYREYDRGIVLVNPTRTTQAASITLSRSRRHTTGLKGGAAGAGSILTVKLPPRSGEVYRWR